MQGEAQQHRFIHFYEPSYPASKFNFYLHREQKILYQYVTQWLVIHLILPLINTY